MTDEEWKREKELRRQDRRMARQAEWEKVRALGAGARLRYFWDYYKFVLVLVIALIVAVRIAHTIYVGMHTETVFYAAMLNPDVVNTDADRLGEDFAQTLGGLEKDQQLVIDTSLSITPGSYSQQDIAAVMKVTAFIQAGSLDVMVGPAKQIAFEQSQGLLMELEDVLSQEQIAQLDAAGDLYYDTEPVLPTGDADETESTEWTLPNLFEGETEAPFLMPTQPGEATHIYAVRVDDAGVLDGYAFYGDEPIWLGLIGSTQHRETALQFLGFLRGEQTGALINENGV